MSRLWGEHSYFREANRGRRKGSLAHLYETAVSQVLQFRQRSGKNHSFWTFTAPRVVYMIERCGGHNEPAKKRRDAERTEFLNKKGIEVVRFWNHMVLREIDGVFRGAVTSR